MEIYKKFKKIPGTWKFFIIALLITGVTAVAKPTSILPSLQISWSILKKIIPVLIGVFVLQVIVNYFVKPKKLAMVFENKKSIKGWLIAIAAGIISTGPVYVWYSMLADLREKGMSNGFVAAFLYNRSIKIPLLPMMAAYFGVLFVGVLAVVTIVFSVFQGILLEKILDKEQNKNENSNISKGK